MSRNIDRLLKMQDCRGVEFSARDQHGDPVTVRIEGDAAQQLLDYLQAGIKGTPKPGGPLRPTE